MTLKSNQSNDVQSAPSGGVAAGKTAGEVRQQAKAVVKHPAGAATLSGQERHFRIRLAAFRRAEERGFLPGRELEDWLVAEQEVDAQIKD